MRYQSIKGKNKTSIVPMSALHYRMITRFKKRGYRTKKDKLKEDIRHECYLERGCYNLGRNKRVKKLLTKENLERLLKAGLNKTQIAKRYNISIPTVSRYLKKYDL